MGVVNLVLQRLSGPAEENPNTLHCPLMANMPNSICKKYPIPHYTVNLCAV